MVCVSMVVYFGDNLKKIEHSGRTRPNLRFASRDKKSPNLTN